MAVRSILGSAVAALAATLPMDQASSWLYQRQNQRATERAEERRAEMPTSVLVGKTATRLGRQPTDVQADRLGMLVHDAFGGGPAAKLLTRVRVSPLPAALGIAATMSALVDESANALLDFTPPQAAVAGGDRP